jgi:hypothetical protein
VARGLGVYRPGVGGRSRVRIRARVPTRGLSGYWPGMGGRPQVRVPVGGGRHLGGGNGCVTDSVTPVRSSPRAAARPLETLPEAGGTPRSRAFFQAPRLCRCCEGPGGRDAYPVLRGTGRPGVRMPVPPGTGSRGCLGLRSWRRHPTT